MATATATLNPTVAAPRAVARRWQRALQNRMVLFGGAIVLLMALAALFAPLIAPHSPYEQFTVDQLVPPNSTYPLGTDELGRDVFSRLLFGARISIQVALISVTIGVLLGGSLGMLAAYHGGAADMLIMRFADILFAVPSLLLALAMLGPLLANVMVASGIIFIPIFVRVTCAAGLAIVQEPYVEASNQPATKCVGAMPASTATPATHRLVTEPVLLIPSRPMG